MKKLTEMTADELMTCICKMADPAERIFADNEVLEALDGFRAKITEDTTVQAALSIFAGTAMPRLMANHKQDVYEVVGAMCGQTAIEVAQGNGGEALRNIFVVFALERDVETIFRAGSQARS